jgi:hypothetical protein
MIAGAYLVPQDAAAQESEAPQAAIASSATATISNLLPADGCSYPVTIGDVDYAPDAASLAAVRDRVPAGTAITVRIDYRLTGRTAHVECGFGNTLELPEISFHVR